MEGIILLSPEFSRIDVEVNYFFLIFLEVVTA